MSEPTPRGAFSALIKVIRGKLGSNANPEIVWRTHLQDFVPYDEINGAPMNTWTMEVDGVVVSEGRSGEEALRKYAESL